MYKKLLAFISTALITACTSHSNNSDNSKVSTTDEHIPTSQLIVPGKSIGKIYINQNIDSVIAKLGKPNFADNAMGASLNIWYGNHDSVSDITAVFSRRDFGNDTVPPSLIKIIHITSPDFKTNENIRVGSDYNKLKQYYKFKQLGYYYMPKKDTLKVFDDVAGGIGIEADGKNKVVGILIHASKDSLLANTSIRMHMNYKRL